MILIVVKILHLWFSPALRFFGGYVEVVWKSVFKNIRITRPLNCSKKGNFRVRSEGQCPFLAWCFMNMLHLEFLCMSHVMVTVDRIQKQSTVLLQLQLPPDVTCIESMFICCRISHRVCPDTVNVPQFKPAAGQDCAISRLRVSSKRVIVTNCAVALISKVHKSRAPGLPGD